MLQTKLTKTFTKGVFILAAPVMLQQLISAFASLVDNLMVGSLGKDAIVSVGASNQVFFVVLLLGFGIGEGASIFIAQQFGSKKFHEMHYTFLIGLIFGGLVGILGAIGVFYFQDLLISQFTNEPQQITLASEYISIAVFSYPLILINIVIGSAYRSCGNTVVPMIAGVTAIISNTILNLILIFGLFGAPAMGVAGAATATVISRVLELLFLSIFMQVRHMPFVPKLRDVFTIPFALVKTVILKSLPLIGNEFLWGLGTTTLMAFYGTRSSSDYASIQIAYTTANLLFVVMSGFAVAVSILIGQELGKSELDKARYHSKLLIQLSILTGLCVSIIAVALSFITPHFYDVSNEIQQLSANILRVMAIFFPLYILSTTFFFIMRAGGDVLGVILMDALYMWIIVIPVAFLVINYTAIPIVFAYMIVQSTEIFKCLIGLYRYKTGKWVKNLVSAH